MRLFNDIVTVATAIRNQLNKDAFQVETTGKVWFDMNSEAIWFQVEDGFKTTSWVSLDFPEYAAPGETVVVAADEDDMRHFDENRQPPATYSVGASDVEGLEPDEALYTGLTREEARDALTGVIDLGEPEKYNYWMKREK